MKLVIRNENSSALAAVGISISRSEADQRQEVMVHGLVKIYSLSAAQNHESVAQP
jgi:hypothetical protein